MAMVPVYKEIDKKDAGDESLAKTFGYWLPEDAMQIPTEGNFERPFLSRDGTMHILIPAHWVFMKIDGHEDIEGAVLPFQSIGNSFYKDMEKIVKAESEIVPQLRFKVSPTFKDNEKFKKRFWYPKFELVGRNFEYADGKLSKIASDLTVADVRYLLEQYSTIMKDYREGRLVSFKGDITGLLGGTVTPQKAIGSGTAKGKGKSYEEDDTPAPEAGKTKPKMKF
jgi:hypothetical protein